jgi:hypothetical protein
MPKRPNKPVGLTKDTGWQAGLRRTISAPAEVVWELLLSPAGIEIWLGEGDPFPFEQGSSYQLRDGTTGEIKVLRLGSHWRITRKPLDPAYTRPSTMQIRIINKDDRCVLAFHEEHLPNEQKRQLRKAFYLGVVEKIEGLLLAN